MHCSHIPSVSYFLFLNVPASSRLHNMQISRLAGNYAFFFKNGTWRRGIVAPGLGAKGQYIRTNVICESGSREDRLQSGSLLQTVEAEENEHYSILLPKAFSPNYKVIPFPSNKASVGIVRAIHGHLSCTTRYFSEYDVRDRSQTSFLQIHNLLSQKNAPEAIHNSPQECLWVEPSGRSPHFCSP
ncbi:hypothetical protein P152DRAFT_219715 [Eremomyces bilateralis CBS 781.70]|uniref:Uncharacterized protein n=1 Tax=Eremomyces bilateralis CBS 781.70 TaxID=1392243 RepID=A0A6G1FRU3_9PEZI|nr:uncharacterized protein P152DRAFT_219715 [Eremomyces bilateralis CBS 781.70]KAF1808392.1 hypothetical protein P152DRAFT_219715 [Eremomyces bilateralis CBS 781.70]